MTEQSGYSDSEQYGCNPNFDHNVGCNGRVALSVFSLTGSTGGGKSKSMLFLKYFYIKRAQAVCEWDKGLCQSLHMAILNAHVQFHIDWATHQGVKWIQTDRQTKFSSFYSKIVLQKSATIYYNLLMTFTFLQGLWHKIFWIVISQDNLMNWKQ